jgi:hypothetical protein
MGQAVSMMRRTAVYRSTVGRRASRATIATIGYIARSPYPLAVSAKKTRNAIDQSAAIAVKIQDQRMPLR